MRTISTKVRVETTGLDELRALIEKSKQQADALQDTLDCIHAAQISITYTADADTRYYYYCCSKCGNIVVLAAHKGDGTNCPCGGMMMRRNRAR